MEKKLRDLEGKISTLEQAVTTLTSELTEAKRVIDSKVDKDKVISSINYSEEGIRINGDKIYIDASTLIDYKK